MNKIKMIADVSNKISELEVAIEKGKGEEKAVGRLKRQVRPLYVIRELLSLIDTDDIKLTTQKDFTQLIECSKGRTTYEFEEGQTIMQLLAIYPNLTMDKLNTKLDKIGLKLDLATGVVVKK